jgi:hypothetical protein
LVAAFSPAEPGSLRRLSAKSSIALWTESEDDMHIRSTTDEPLYSYKFSDYNF